MMDNKCPKCGKPVVSGGCGSSLAFCTNKDCPLYIYGELLSRWNILLKRVGIVEVKR